MAQVATNVETILAAVRDHMLTAVVPPGDVFLTDDPDDLASLGALQDDRIVAIWWRELEQRPGDVSSEPPEDEVPIVRGELVVSCYARVELDQPGQADAATAATTGTPALTRAVLRALNDWMPRAATAGTPDLLTESLTFRRMTNRGRVRNQERWRRVDVSFDLTFEFDLSA